MTAKSGATYSRENVEPNDAEAATLRDLNAVLGGVSMTLAEYRYSKELGGTTDADVRALISKLTNAQP